MKAIKHFKLNLVDLFSISSIFLFLSCSTPLIDTFKNTDEVSNTKSKEYPKFNSKRWMTDIHDILKHKKIWEVSAVGSHNSLNLYGGKFKWYDGWYFPRVIYYNQNRRIRSQFEYGCRYFDTRIDPDSGTLKSYHGNTSPFFKNHDVSQDLIALANSVRGTKEIIILHLKGDRHITTIDGKQVVKDLVSEFFMKHFDDLIIKRSQTPNGLKNTNIEDIKGNIIISAVADPTEKYHDIFWRDHDFMINYLYYDKQSDDAKYLAAAEKNMIKYIDSGALDNKIQKFGYAYDPGNGSIFSDLHKKAIEFNTFFLKSPEGVKKWMESNYRFYIAMDFVVDDNGSTNLIQKYMYDFYVKNWQIKP